MACSGLHIAQIIYQGPKGEKGDPGDDGAAGGGVSQATLDAAIDDLINGAPADLDTLGEIATFINNLPGGGANVSVDELYSSPAVGGEVTINIVGSTAATFLWVFNSTAKLKKYTGADPIPTGYYRREAGDEIDLGDELQPGEEVQVTLITIT